MEAGANSELVHEEKQSLSDELWIGAPPGALPGASAPVMAQRRAHHVGWSSSQSTHLSARQRVAENQPARSTGQQQNRQRHLPWQGRLTSFAEQ